MTATVTIVRASDMSKQAFALREQYYALRKRGFEAKWGENFYPDGPNDCDLRADTVFTLLVEDGKVIAGARAVFHPVGSTIKTPMEEKHPAFAINNLLPPKLVTPTLSYCELTGIVADPDTQYHDRHLGTQVTEAALNLVRAKVIHNNGKRVDVVITSASSLGLGPIVRAANKLGIKGIVRQDLIQREEDTRFDTKLWPMVMTFNPHWHLTTPEMKAKGAIGESLDEFAKQEKRQL